ncbi:glycoside hydrolase family 3 protein [Pseudodesulfovibrio sediminis]|uniref:beta-N-acetylhexosaminidase n=1 Tax=Pseudodesulfovibrio sediminis TaxID=2810563 RepID=A0ABM7PAJ2_9BACT|nr:glycoside hydrolase family 3 N-terminal domain-containing protein [Pseudodesulfovibrio sediminis]BCS90101.1 glycosyl hydrolase [Pseudodesulfovibrio sediminis]
MKRCLIATLLSVIILFPSTAPAADLDVMVGQMLMAGFRGFDVDANDQISRDITEYHLGGVILFDYDVVRGKAERNIQSKQQVKTLINELRSFASIPLLVAVDQEGGKVQRLKKAYGFLETPSAHNICASGEFKVRIASFTIGTTLNSVGFNLDFAPVVDVNVDPNSPAIGKLGRSFSSDPDQVARCAGIYMDELKRNDVLACLKHFPGHGSAGSDSHKGLTDVTKTWTKAELIPYRTLIDQGKVQMIMTAHIFNGNLDPDYPATLSKNVITGILRNDLGYNGVVITDDMNMGAITEFYGQKEAIRLAIEAGADMLLFGNNISYDKNIVAKAHTIIMGLVRSGKISQDRIEQSYTRIMRLKEAL